MATTQDAKHAKAAATKVNDPPRPPTILAEVSANDKAIQDVDNAITYLRKNGKTLSKQEKKDWTTLLGQLSTRIKQQCLMDEKTAGILAFL